MGSTLYVSDFRLIKPLIQSLKIVKCSRDFKSDLRWGFFVEINR